MSPGASGDNWGREMTATLVTEACHAHLKQQVRVGNLQNALNS